MALIKIKNVIKILINKELTENKIEPLEPKKRPNNKIIKKENKGTKITNKYI